MNTAQNLKSQSTQIKRTVTGIRSIIAYGEVQRRYHNTCLLSEADVKALEKAAGILNQIRSKTSSMSTTAATQERARELALKKATDEATKLFAQWPAAMTTLDKIALIVGNRAEQLLRQDIAKDEVAGGWTWTLNYWFEEARREIPGQAAYTAVTSNKPIAELIHAAATRLAEIKANPGVELLAARWQVKLDKEASGARK
jgi:hypothetical protein